MRVICCTDTVVQPLAMMIKLVAASVTLFAMFSMRMRSHITNMAMIRVILLNPILKLLIVRIKSLIVYQRIC